MKFRTTKAFEKALDALDKKWAKRINAVMKEIAAASSIHEITDVKKLVEYNNVYRIRVGSKRAFFTFHIEVIDDYLFLRFLVNRGQAYDRKMQRLLRKADEESHE